MHVVISGFGQLGRAILREVARRSQMVPGSVPPEVVLWHAAAEEVAKVTDAFPVISGNCTIMYGDVSEVPGHGEYTVYVCLDDDDDALSEGLATAHSLAGQRGRVVVCMREYDLFAPVLAWRSGLVDDLMGRLSVFGVIQEACIPANIRDDFTERLARSIHNAYVAMQGAKGETPVTDPWMVPWERLPEDLRQSNIAQAADIGAKLEEIGAIVVPRSASAPVFAFTDPETEHLGQLEHQRWMREMLAAGWKYGSPMTTRVRPTPICGTGITSASRKRTSTATPSVPFPRPCVTRASRSFASRRTPSPATTTRIERPGRLRRMIDHGCAVQHLIDRDPARVKLIVPDGRALLAADDTVRLRARASTWYLELSVCRKRPASTCRMTWRRPSALPAGRSRT